MQDDWLYFGQHAEGAYGYLRPGTLRGAVFTWILSEGTLTTRTVRQFSGDDFHRARRGDGHSFDVRQTRVLFSEQFAFQLQRTVRVLELRPGKNDRAGMRRRGPIQFAYLRPECPKVLTDQIARAHAYFDPRGGLPRPSH